MGRRAKQQPSKALQSGSGRSCETVAYLNQKSQLSGVHCIHQYHSQILASNLECVNLSLPCKKYLHCISTACAPCSLEFQLCRRHVFGSYITQRGSSPQDNLPFACIVVLQSSYLTVALLGAAVYMQTNNHSGPCCVPHRTLLHMCLKTLQMVHLIPLICLKSVGKNMHNMSCPWTACVTVKLPCLWSLHRHIQGRVGSFPKALSSAWVGITSTVTSCGAA